VITRVCVVCSSSSKAVETQKFDHAYCLVMLMQSRGMRASLAGEMPLQAAVTSCATKSATAKFFSNHAEESSTALSEVVGIDLEEDNLRERYAFGVWQATGVMQGSVTFGSWHTRICAYFCRAASCKQDKQTSRCNRVSIEAGKESQCRKCAL